MPKRLETAGLVVAFITWNNLMLSFTYSFVSTFIWEFSILFYFALFYFPLSPVLCLCLTFWTSETQFTGVGSCSLLQGIFPNQESNPGLPHCRQILYQLNYKGSLRILEWVAHPFTSHLPDSGIKSGCLALQGNSLPAELSGKPLFYGVPE